MADKERDDEDERDDIVVSSGVVGAEQHSFFAIYKRGQGYWTRLGTALGVALLLAVFAYFVHAQSTQILNQTRNGSQFAASNGRFALGIMLGAIFLGGLLAWWLMNRPRNVDFLIATDAEMKKVNWTSRKQLWGSTKVVIMFMLLLVGVLFLFDVISGTLLYLVGVVQINPLGK